MIIIRYVYVIWLESVKCPLGKHRRRRGNVVADGWWSA